MWIHETAEILDKEFRSQGNTVISQIKDMAMAYAKSHKQNQPSPLPSTSRCAFPGLLMEIYIIFSKPEKLMI